MADHRIRNLDGIRGIAIALVLAGHSVARLSISSGGPNKWCEAFANPGAGVRLFFVLSGYLITSILIKEKARTGSVSLRNFYLRRILRIFPAFYVFLVLLAILNWRWELGVDNASLAAAGTFTWNYAALWHQPPPGSWYVGHLWTLSLEQQFYLLWPATIATLGMRRSTIVAAGLIVWCPLARLATYALFPAQRGMTGMMFHTGIDSIMVGCAAALLVAQPQWASRLRQHRRVLLLCSLIWLALVSPVASVLIRGFGISAGFTGDAVAAAVLVACAHLAPPSWLSRVLGRGPLPFLGIISYSLYLWQQLYLGTAGPLGRVPLTGALALGLVTALLSYLLVERPALRLKQGMRSAAAAGSPSAAVQTSS